MNKVEKIPIKNGLNKKVNNKSYGNTKDPSRILIIYPPYISMSISIYNIYYNILL